MRLSSSFLSFLFATGTSVAMVISMTDGTECRRLKSHRSSGCRNMLLPTMKMENRCSSLDFACSAAAAHEPRAHLDRGALLLHLCFGHGSPQVCGHFKAASSKILDVGASACFSGSLSCRVLLSVVGIHEGPASQTSPLNKVSLNTHLLRVHAII